MASSIVQRLLRGVTKSAHRADWPRFAGDDWPAQIMNEEVTDSFIAKQGRSTGRWVVNRGGESVSVYLKRHYRLPWWRGVMATLLPRFRWSPALQEAANLEWARNEGVPVPDTAAEAEYIGPWMRLQSVLAVEELHDMMPLHQAIPFAAETMSASHFHEWKKRLIAETARVSRLLHDAKRYHKDLYLCHFYLPKELIHNWTPANRIDFADRLHVIDLHRLAHHRWTWFFYQGKDLAQLLYSTYVNGITPRDRIRFWRVYRGATKRGWWTRWFERMVLVRWRRYSDHNRKKEIAALRKAA